MGLIRGVLEWDLLRGILEVYIIVHLSSVWSRGWGIGSRVYG